MTNSFIKTMVVAASLGATALLAGCDNPAPENDYQQMELDTETVDAAAADEAATPAVAEVTEAPADTPPVESVPLEPRTSEESVQPDSETLFY